MGARLFDNASGIVRRLAVALMVLAMNACATHMDRVLLDQHEPRPLHVIGLPQFESAKKIDIRQDNPLFSIIGLSAKAVQQLVREYKRIQYQNANPDLLEKSLMTMRQSIRQHLQQQGYIVRDLPMTYWQAQAAYRKRAPELAGVDALLHVKIKRFGYMAGSPFKPYRPGTVLTADLMATKDRKQLASNVYNVGFDPEDLSKLEFQVNYFTNVAVANKNYFYRNFDALLANARQSKRGLEVVAKAAAENIAADLKMRPSQIHLVSNKPLADTNR